VYEVDMAERSSLRHYHIEDLQFLGISQFENLIEADFPELNGFLICYQGVIWTDYGEYMSITFSLYGFEAWNSAVSIFFVIEKVILVSSRSFQINWRQFHLKECHIQSALRSGKGLLDL